LARLISNDEYIELKCNNYRNPLHAEESSGWNMIIKDREAIDNSIVLFPEYRLNTLPDSKTKEIQLNPVPWPAGESISFAFKGGVVPIQSPSELTIRFKVPVPIGAKGCYFRLKFPADLPIGPEKSIITFVAKEVLSLYKASMSARKRNTDLVIPDVNIF
jgi:hypothetical protein